MLRISGLYAVATLALAASLVAMPGTASAGGPGGVGGGMGMHQHDVHHSVPNKFFPPSHDSTPRRTYDTPSVYDNAPSSDFGIAVPRHHRRHAKHSYNQ